MSKVGGPSLKRRLFSGSAWALAGKVATAIVVLIANALLARLLTPSDLGAYFLAFSLVSLGALLGSLGLNQIVVRLVAEGMGLNQVGRVKRAIGVVAGLGALGATGVAVTYLLFGETIGGELFRAPALVSVSGLVAMWMAVTALQMLLAETFRGFHDIRLATLFNGLAAWVLFVLGLAFLWTSDQKAPLSFVVLLAASSTLASVIVGGWLLRRKATSLVPQGGAAPEAGVRELLGAAWPLLVTNLTLFALTQADIWIMGTFRPQDEVAVYGAAARVVLLVAMPLVVVNSVVPPLIAEMHAQGRKAQLERALRATATLAGIPALIALAALIVLGGPILGLIYGEYYARGVTVLALLSLGQLASVWTGSCGLTLMMTGHNKTMMGITVVSGLVMVVAGLRVVDVYGATGVAAATAAGLVLQNVGIWIAAKRKTGMWTHLGFVGFSDLLKAPR